LVHSLRCNRPGAFNGKVDSILARLKPANQGRLIQEIKDAYALVNHNGEVFKVID
jgi:hypothetical protein